MRPISIRPAVCLLALACAAAPSLALAQRPELPPVYPAAARPAAARTASASPQGVTPATATPKAAVVQIVDDDAHAPYKEGVFTGCTVAGVCTVAFSAVPAGHRRIVEHLSCSIYVSTTGALRYVAFLAGSYTAPRDFVPYTRSPADAGQYFVHVPEVFPFEAGETPLIYAFADSSPIQDLTCTITGRDVVLP